MLSNAHKFTENNGEITVTVLESADEEGVSELRFSVCDTGIGIPGNRSGTYFWIV